MCDQVFHHIVEYSVLFLLMKIG